MLRRMPDQTTQTPPLDIEAASQRYEQAAQLVYLRGIAHENADPFLPIDRRVGLMRVYLLPAVWPRYV